VRVYIVPQSLHVDIDQLEKFCHFGAILLYVNFHLLITNKFR
jgi:hypothetical protein